MSGAPAAGAELWPLYGLLLRASQNLIVALCKFCGRNQVKSAPPTDSSRPTRRLPRQSCAPALSRKAVNRLSVEGYKTSPRICRPSKTITPSAKSPPASSNAGPASAERRSTATVSPAMRGGDLNLLARPDSETGEQALARGNLSLGCDGKSGHEISSREHST